MGVSQECASVCHMARAHAPAGQDGSTIERAEEIQTLASGSARMRSQAGGFCEAYGSPQSLPWRVIREVV